MAEFHPQGGSGLTAERSHEDRDMSVRLVVLFGIALTVVLVGSHYLLEALFSKYTATTDRLDQPHPPVREDRLVPPEPRLQTNPGGDLEALRREEDRRLESYGWIDREHRVLRIPIDRAVDEVLRRGVPARSAARSVH